MQGSLTAFGGSGEHGRNCYALSVPEGFYLFDCGVKKTVHGREVGAYPFLSRESVSKIRAVFLSHVHEDHCAALPFLYHLGYQGVIYASPESIAMVRGMLDKWRSYVTRKGGVLPYTEADCRALQFVPMSPGTHDIEGIRVTAGFSGHMLGSFWYHVNSAFGSFYYSGDTVLNPLLLKRDLPPQAETAVLDCGYAGRHIDSEAQCQQLISETRQVLKDGGKVLFPLPPKGRAADVWSLLSRTFTGVPFYVDEAIDSYIKSLLSHAEYLQKGKLSAGLTGRIVLSNDERFQICRKDEPAVILTQDGMLTAPEGHFYLEQLKKEARHKVIFTGKLSKGTEGNLLFSDAYCHQNDIYLQKCRVIFKVHLDEEDTIALADEVRAEQCLLFHARKDANDGILQKLRDRGIDARILAPGETWKL
jgi:Cft2 family RNA processing exonuclease